MDALRRSLTLLLMGAGVILTVSNLSFGQVESTASDSRKAATPLKEREQIGQVLGKPVFRDQTILPGDKARDDDLLRRQQRENSILAGLFIRPLIDKFQQDHKADTTPTKEELDFTHSFFLEKHRKELEKEGAEWNRQLKEIEEKLKGPLSEEERQELTIQKIVLNQRQSPPPEMLASFLMKNLKWQRYLYRHYGGGRVLFQQGGVEAFDAMHRWIEEQEAQGEFKITDPALRAMLYSYWTEWSHGPFLTDDPARIEASLNPEWAIKFPLEDVLPKDTKK